MPPDGYPALQYLQSGRVRKIEYWIVPPVADGEFVSLMEEGLEAYERLYEPARPVLLMDEMPVQSLPESGVSIPATRHYGKRVRY